MNKFTISLTGGNVENSVLSLLPQAFPSAIQYRAVLNFPNAIQVAYTDENDADTAYTTFSISNQNFTVENVPFKDILIKSAIAQTGYITIGEGKIDLAPHSIQAISEMNDKIPALIDGRLPVDVEAITVNTGDVNVDVSTLATHVLQTAGNASLASIDTKLDTLEVKITDGAGTVDTKALGTQVVNGDIGLITNTVIHGVTTGGGGGYVDVKVNPSGALTVESTVSSSTLPSGASTSAKQDTIIAGIDNIGVKADAAATTDAGTFSLIALVKRLLEKITAKITVIVDSSALPSGASTSAKQDTQTTALQAIQTGTPTSLGRKTSANSQPVVIASDQGAFDVLFEKSLISPFGDLVTAELTPALQFDFVYGLNSQITATTTAGGGTVTTSNGRALLQTSTGTSGSAILRSYRPVKYREGQGVISRFTAVFTTGMAQSSQFMGMGNSTDGYFFGYDGTSFGICHRVRSVDTWTAQASFNGDKVNGSGASGFTIDTTKGNVYMIRYPYLGYGAITFWVLSSSGSWILCHTIQYPNSSTATQLSNANLYFYSQAINSGNNTDLSIYCGSVGTFLCGKRSIISSPKGASDSTKASITTETNIITLKNATTYNGVTNRSLIRLNSFSVSTPTNNTSVTVRFKISPTVGGTPSFTTYNGTTADNGVTITNGNSVVSYDVAGTTITGGTYVFNFTIGAQGNGTIDLSDYYIFIAPGETLAISASASSSATVNCSVNWTEDI